MRSTEPDERWILTIDGIPCPRPMRSDYSDAIDYLRTVWAWRDKISNAANCAFSEAFTKALKEK